MVLVGLDKWVEMMDVMGQKVKIISRARFIHQPFLYFLFVQTPRGCTVNMDDVVENNSAQMYYEWVAEVKRTVPKERLLVGACISIFPFNYFDK